VWKAKIEVRDNERKGKGWGMENRRMEEMGQGMERKRRRLGPFVTKS